MLRGIDSFAGVFPSDRLPRRRLTEPTLLVVNTDRATEPGEHWIAIYVDGNGYGELFDSLATVSLKTFNAFMNRNCKRWIRSDVQLQSVISRFCGHYVTMYCILRSRGFDLPRITSFFTRDTALNDFLVHSFVCRNRVNKSRSNIS